MQLWHMAYFVAFLPSLLAGLIIQTVTGVRQVILLYLPYDIVCAGLWEKALILHSTEGGPVRYITHMWRDACALREPYKKERAGCWTVRVGPGLFSGITDPGSNV
jgi:hypothetical protein